MKMWNGDEEAFCKSRSTQARIKNKIKYTKKLYFVYKG
jgi:hypothetical protein